MTLQLDLPVPGERTPPGAGTAPRPSWRARLYRWEGRSAPYVYIAPFFVLFAAFGLFPLVYTAWISLHRYKLGSSMSWVGLDNYTWLLTNPGFYNALWKTITIGVLSTVPQLLLALGLAHLLNYRLRGRTFLRVAMLMPYATSVAAATLVFALIFGRDAGVVNGLLALLGVDPVDWRNGDWTAQIAISVIVIWRWTGYNALIYLAAMQSIPRDVYESASIDGASPSRQFWSMTVPMLRPTIIFTVIISTIGGLQLFGEPLLFGGGGNPYLGGSDRQFQTVTMFLMEQFYMKTELGRAATVAWLLFIMILIFSIINFLVTGRIDSPDSKKKSKKGALR